MIHPLSDVKSPYIGENTNIWQFCVIFPEARIGSGCNICAQVLIENDVVIGNRCTVKSGVQLWDGIRIEDDVFIGPNATFTNDHVPRSRHHKPVVEKTVIRKGASIGANSTIVAGNTVGEYALVGAGSVVTKNIPAHTVWYGNPAKQHGFVTKSGIILDNEKRDSDGVIRNLEE